MVRLGIFTVTAILAFVSTAHAQQKQTYVFEEDVSILVGSCETFGVHYSTYEIQPDLFTSEEISAENGYSGSKGISMFHRFHVTEENVFEEGGALVIVGANGQAMTAFWNSDFHGTNSLTKDQISINGIRRSLLLTRTDGNDWHGLIVSTGVDNDVVGNTSNAIKCNIPLQILQLKAEIHNIPL